MRFNIIVRYVERMLSRTGTLAQRWLPVVAHCARLLIELIVR